MDQLTASQLAQLHPVRRLAERQDAETWLVDLPAGERYARKTMATPLLAMRARALFQQRLRVVARLNHPQVARIRAGWVQRTECVTVTEYAPRGSLQDAVAAAEGRLWTLPMPPLEAMRLIGEIAAGVQALHANGVIHGGLKLTNILLVTGTDAVWHTKITDAVLHEGFINGTLRIGTARPTDLTDPWRYLAPEQYQQRPDLASDQFSLAVIAFLLLTGESPYAVDPIAFLQVREPLSIRLASSLNPTLPRTVDGVFARAMQRVPRARYPSVRVFAEELQTALGGQRSQRAVKLAPGSIPNPMLRGLGGNSVTQPHEDLRPPVPLALRTGTPGAPVPGLPDLPPQYRWADEVVTAHSRQMPALPPVNKPLIRRRRAVPAVVSVTVTLIVLALLLTFALVLMHH